MLYLPRAAALSLLSVLISSAAAIAQSSDEPPYVGFSRAAAERQRGIERRIVELADSERVGEFARTLAGRPHVAGTPAQAATRDYVIEQMRAWGLATSVATYDVYLPFTTETLLERTQPSPKTFLLREPALAEDEYTQHELPFTFQNGYAAAGDVTAPLVYVNYATKADLDELEGLGVSLEGCIAIARYGRGYRGNKVRNVAERGAIGCVIYTDPADDGYFKGDVYPVGPMRPEHGVQHGSVKLGPPGDPTTPRHASLPDAERVDPANSEDLNKIPSMPINAAIARELLADLGGPEVPQEWQGALPFRYHVGAGPTAVRLRVAHDGGRREIFDTFGRIEGSEFPDEWIIVGGHRDAWCCGAADNVSGTAGILESARICAELAKAGSGPRRTLIFATWDAEEWGIIGSAEWVEDQRDELLDKLIAYVNQDMVVTGPDFGASGAPSMKPLVRAITQIVPNPNEQDRTIFDVWRGDEDEAPNIGTPGGGSDHGPFYLHLGIPVSSHGFGGRQGTYHSLYDTPAWMEKFGDPGYRRHRANATMTAMLLMRLANADTLPLDHREEARELVEQLEKLEDEFKALDAAELYERVKGHAAEFVAAAESFEQRRAAVGDLAIDSSSLQAVNDRLRRVGPTLTRRAAGDGDATAFYQNLLNGLAGGGGYAASRLPGLRAALDAEDTTKLAHECDVLGGQIRAATKLLTEATNELPAETAAP